MTRSTTAFLLITAFSLTLPGCGKPADGKTGAESRPPLAVETAKAAPSDLEESVEVVGTLTARSEAEVKLAAANHADFSFIRKGVTGLGEEHEIPVYLPAESASEAAAAEESGAQGVWLEF